MRQMQSKSCLTHLECTACGNVLPLTIQTLCPKCGMVLFARYDLQKARNSIDGSNAHPKSKNRSFNIFRYPEIMPINESKYHITLGEGWTPLLKLKNSMENLKLGNTYLKDEGQNPTGTFKSRGLCAAVAKATELGIKKFIIPTAGNAGAALAAYTARVGGEAFVIMPQDTPKFLQTEVKALGGKIKLVPGTIKDAALYVKEIAHEQNYFDVSTLKEPYRVEGKKTMAYEIVEQLNWGLPDIIIYPTGGGTGIVGMWKAFKEMEELKLIGSKKPKIVSVQSSGCAPIVKAFDEKKSRADFWDYASTIAPGLRVPNAIGDYLILQAIYESKGTAVAVTDEDILLAMKKIAKQEGIMLAPEAAAPFASLTQLRESGFITQDQSVILFGTGSGLLYPELW